MKAGKICLLVALLVLMSFTAVFADSETPDVVSGQTADDHPVIASVSIGGSHRIENNSQLKTGRHTFVLTGKENSPMPEGSDNNIKKVTISSGEDFDFGEIDYRIPGIYEYTVSRELIPSKDLEEDDTVYKAKVAVFSDGTSVLVFDKIGTNGKPNKIEYSDKYIKPSDDDDDDILPKTGDTTRILIYVLPFAASSLILLILLLKNRRKDN